MGNELSRADLLDNSLSDKDYFEKFFLLFSDKIDSYLSYDITIYRYVISELDILYGLSNECSNVHFINRCIESQGDYYTLEILERVREVSDLVGWIATELSVTPTSVIPIAIQHPVFFVEPPLEIVLKNIERIIRWYKRYSTVLTEIDQYSYSFTQKFFFGFFCDKLAEKVKMIH
jgi:hypothetical protein